MLTPVEYRLINGREFEAVPACLYRAKSNAQARLLAQSDWLIRDKANGAYLASYHQQRLHLFQRGPKQRTIEDGFNELMAAHRQEGLLRPSFDTSAILEHLGIDQQHYSELHQLELIAEPYVLEYAGRDRYNRPLWLEFQTKRAWLNMREAAKSEDVFLDAISGYRSCQYQKGIFERKLARGQTIKHILTVNAAPGFSEHHSGRAIDIGTTNEPAAEESFENTEAFHWLTTNAIKFKFKLSYPRDNAHGINYEPWHWCWQE